MPTRHFSCLVASDREALGADKALFVPCCERARGAGRRQGTFSALLRATARRGVPTRHFSCLVRATARRGVPTRHFSCLVAADREARGANKALFVPCCERPRGAGADKALFVPCCGRPRGAGRQQGTFRALLRATARRGVLTRHFSCLVAGDREALGADKALFVPCCERPRGTGCRQGTFRALLRATARRWAPTRHFRCLVAGDREARGADKALLVPCCERSRGAGCRQGTFGALLRATARRGVPTRHFWCLVASNREALGANK
ncbi:hypothetical protein J2Z45_002839, partial [Cohnella lubricantis]|nr:hypothetical protein [Cohnella lubricantis]